jgi:hypothetical protein
MLITAKRLALPAGCDRNVTVQAGDTCDAISAANSVSTYVSSSCHQFTCSSYVWHRYQLATVNSGIIDSACDNLYIGEVRHFDV